MKLNIQITQIGTGLTSDELIADIDVCNGNWKYWDKYMETDEKVSLTLNTIRQSYYIELPIKDAYGFHDFDLYDKTGELKIESAAVRTYNTLLDYLNCRIGNIKEDVKKGHYERYYAEEGGRTFNAVLFKEPRTSKDVCEAITYNKKAMIEVKIAVVE